LDENTGQKSGQAGFSWGDYLAALVEEHGTLTAVAWKLVEHGDDVANIERGLRRLRSKESGDGGTWGRRLLRQLGLPRPIEARLRWMGLYHSPFNDLPLPLCLDQLRLWDRPPVAESRARVWLHLGFASTALRRRDFAAAGLHLDDAARASPPPDAQLEIALSRAYLLSRVGGDGESELERAARLLGEAPLDEVDRACFTARHVDHRAYKLNRARRHDEAFALYQSLPAEDRHPFASYRRDAGLAYGHLQRGERDRALACARRACDHAGDGGYTRLRVMALILLSRLEPADPILQRAEAIATRLDDTELLERIHRRRKHP
jgi:tetratricopeptide (TPR) repeat protein